MIKDLVQKSRSYRRFDETHMIDKALLKELIELARLSPTASNMQPLKFCLSCQAEMNNKIFPALAWAGYLEDWSGPAEGKRPTAYVIILGDKDVRENFGIDHGIAAQSIMLGAAEKGLGGCIIGSVKREELRKELCIPERYAILLVLVLGKPAEKVVIDPLPDDGNTRYYRDEEGVHHVPKRSLDDLILKLC